MDFTDRIKDIERAYRRLAKTTDEQKIARRNARREFLSTLRKLRTDVDEAYPAVVTRTGVTRLTVEGRMARLKRQGYVRVEDETAAYVATTGVRAIRVEGRLKGGTQFCAYFVPRWASILALDPVALRKAVKNPHLRKVALVTSALS